MSSRPSKTQRTMMAEIRKDMKPRPPWTPLEALTARQLRRARRQRLADLATKDRQALGHKPPAAILETYRRYKREQARNPLRMKSLLLYGGGKRVAAWRRAVAIIEGREKWR